jgi:hypothetical protein
MLGGGYPSLIYVEVLKAQLVETEEGMLLLSFFVGLKLYNLFILLRQILSISIVVLFLKLMRNA